jgi:hypothetical protein
LREVLIHHTASTTTAPRDRITPTMEVAVERTTICPLDSSRPPTGAWRVTSTVNTPEVRARTLT